MAHSRRRSFATSLIITGFLMVAVSLGGTWGVAHGQTGGPTPTPRPASLVVTKQVDGPATRQPGEVVTFVIQVRNDGDEDANSVQILDIVPGTLEVLDVHVNPVAPRQTVVTRGQNVQVNLDPIRPGETYSITVITKIRSNARGRITNMVLVRASKVADVQAMAEMEVGASGGAVGGQPGESGAGNAPGQGGAAGGPGAGGTSAVDAAPASGTGSATIPAALPNTGDMPINWFLLIVGLIMVGVGSTVYLRGRKTH